LLAQLAGAALLVLALSLYTVRMVPRARKWRLSSQLGLAALAGLAIAHFFIQTRGEWVPSGWTWLMVVLSTLILPQLIFLTTIGWSALRRTFPDAQSVWTLILSVGANLKPFIKQLRTRKAAKEETPI